MKARQEESRRGNPEQVEHSRILAAAVEQAGRGAGGRRDSNI